MAFHLRADDGTFKMVFWISLPSSIKRKKCVKVELDSSDNSDGIIRIDHEREGTIEKSVPRITDWHHEACRAMTNGDREGRIFPSYPSSHS